MSFVTSDQSGSFTRVANYAALPPASSVPDVVYLTEASQGTFLLGTRKKAGLWRSNGSIWTFLGVEIAQASGSDLTSPNGNNDVRRLSPDNVHTMIINSLYTAPTTAEISSPSGKSIKRSMTPDNVHDMIVNTMPTPVTEWTEATLSEWLKSADNFVYLNGTTSSLEKTDALIWTPEDVTAQAHYPLPLPTGSTRVLVGGRSYYLTANIDVGVNKFEFTGSGPVRLQGNGYSITTSYVGNMFNLGTLSKGLSIHFKGVRLINDAASSSGRVLYCSSSTGHVTATFEDCYFQSRGRVISLYSCLNMTFTGCSFIGAGGSDEYVMYLRGSSTNAYGRLTFIGCHIYSNKAKDMIYISTNSMGMLTIADTSFRGTSLNTATHSAILFADFDETFENSYTSICKLSGLEFYFESSVRHPIKSNTSSDNWATCLYATGLKMKTKTSHYYIASTSKYLTATATTNPFTYYTGDRL